MADQKKSEEKQRCCNATGPGYASPLDAMKHGPREKLLYVMCPSISETKPDFLATVDVDPESPTYSQIIHKLHMNHIGDELHNSGWNACSSCYKNPNKKRSHLVLPCLLSDRVYVIDTSDERKPKIFKEIDPEEIRTKTGTTTPHSAHCLPSGEVMISTVGNKDGEPQGSFILIDAKEWKLKPNWEKDGKPAPMGYDFWYQPKHDVMISTELGNPTKAKKGFDPEDVEKGFYGHHLHVWKWSTHELIQTIDLGPEGKVPLEIRFLHNPDEAQGYVACTLSSNIFRFFKTSDGQWKAEKAISTPSKKVEGWLLNEMPGLIAAFLISLDDKYLFCTNWLHGDIRMFDITDRAHPKLVAQLFIGGSICKDGPVKVIEDKELKEQPDPLYVNGKRVEGGAQRMQLSLDGKRLYVTTSLLSVWDKQFYPELAKKGAFLLLVDVDAEKGRLTLNSGFSVDFGADTQAPGLAHEIRYPGGDCTSDIWLD